MHEMTAGESSVALSRRSICVIADLCRRAPLDASPFGFRKIPCGERPTSMLVIAGLRIKHRHLFRPAACNPQPAIRRKGNVVRAAGNVIRADHRQCCGIDRSGRAADPVVHPDDLAVRRQEQLCAPFPGVDALNHVAIRRFRHSDVVRPHIGHQYLAVLPHHTSRRAADLHLPQHLELVRSIATRLSVPCNSRTPVTSPARNPGGSASTRSGSASAAACLPRRRHRPDSGRAR